MRSHRYLVSIYALLLILSQELSPLHGIDHLLITDNVIKMFEQHKTGGLEIATAGYSRLKQQVNAGKLWGKPLYPRHQFAGQRCPAAQFVPE